MSTCIAYEDVVNDCCHIKIINIFVEGVFGGCYSHEEPSFFVFPPLGENLPLFGLPQVP
jgi:hypothetical protein